MLATALKPPDGVVAMLRIDEPGSCWYPCLTLALACSGQDLKENVGYTALHLLVRDKETGGWEALVSGSADHVQR